MDSTRVRDVMTNLVLTVRPEDEITQVAKRLLASRISGAPVVEEGRLIGIVSETDLVKSYSAARRNVSVLGRDRSPLPGSTIVRDVMTSKVVSIAPEATIWEAANLIDRHSVCRLPVVDADGYVVGVVARADLIRSMAQRQESTRRVPA